jgi:hypothetical protein
MPFAWVLGSFLDAPAKLAHGMRERGPRALLPLMLLASLIFSIPLAYASPADPVWIGGIYDAVDDDEVFGLVTDSNPSGSSGSPLATWRISHSSAQFTAYSPTAPSGLAILCALRFRAPPKIHRDHTDFGSAYPSRPLELPQNPASTMTVSTRLGCGFREVGLTVGVRARPSLSRSRELRGQGRWGDDLHVAHPPILWRGGGREWAFAAMSGKVSRPRRSRDVSTRRRRN